MSEHALKETRTVQHDSTALYQGRRYFFPLAMPGDTVTFIDGKPDAEYRLVSFFWRKESEVFRGC